MSIVVDGVTLPDIPTEYPYTLISTGPGGYTLTAATSPFFYSAAGVLIDNTNLPTISSSGTGAKYDLNDDNEWELGSDGIIESPWVNEGSFIIYEYKVVWANHDIYTVTSVDADTGEYYLGDIYFADSVSTDDRVSIGISLMDGIANEVQRLTGTTDQMNAATMLELLKTAKSGGTREEGDSEVDAGTERASIAYDLFNDIVIEVQRLSGTTEQMNAVTAYRKLTGVMEE